MYWLKYSFLNELFGSVQNKPNKQKFAGDMLEKSKKIQPQNSWEPVYVVNISVFPCRDKGSAQGGELHVFEQ